MIYKITYTTQAIEDLRKVENSAKLQILKAIDKVSENPLPYAKGGYGKPLDHKRNMNLTNLLKTPGQPPRGFLLHEANTSLDLFGLSDRITLRCSGTPHKSSSKPYDAFLTYK